MLKRAVFLAGLAVAGNISLLVAIPAWALDGGRHANAANQPQPLGIYALAGTGVFVGTFAGNSALDHPDGNHYNLMIMRFGGVPYLVEYWGGGFANEGEFFYTTANCTGDAYLHPDQTHIDLDNGASPQITAFDGTVMWAYSPSNGGANLTLQSEKYRETCTTVNFTDTVFKAVVLDSNPELEFQPGFKAK